MRAAPAGWVIAAATLAGAAGARAEVWAFVDGQGLAHVAPHQVDSRYRRVLGDAPGGSGTEAVPGKTDRAASFDGVDELAQLLAGSPEVEACYTLQWSRHAIGSAEASELQCVQDEISAAFTKAEGRLDSLVLALVGTRFFRERGGAVTDDPGSDTASDTGADTGADHNQPRSGQEA